MIYTHYKGVNTYFLMNNIMSAIIYTCNKNDKIFFNFIFFLIIFVIEQNNLNFAIPQSLAPVNVYRLLIK